MMTKSFLVWWKIFRIFGNFDNFDTILTLLKFVTSVKTFSRLSTFNRFDFHTFKMSENITKSWKLQNFLVNFLNIFSTFLMKIHEISSNTNDFWWLLMIFDDKNISSSRKFCSIHESNEQIWTNLNKFFTLSKFSCEFSDEFWVILSDFSWTFDETKPKIIYQKLTKYQTSNIKHRNTKNKKQICKKFTPYGFFLVVMRH